MWLCLKKGKGKGDNTLVLVTFTQLKYVLSNLHKNLKRKHLIQRVGTQDMIIQKKRTFSFGILWLYVEAKAQPWVSFPSAIYHIV